MATSPPLKFKDTAGKVDTNALKPGDVVAPAAGNAERLYIYDLISEGEHRIAVQNLVVQQNIDAKWSESYTFGKMDPISTYQSTQRSFQIGFVTAAHAYITINTLTQLMYPSFVKSLGATNSTGGTAAAAAQKRFGLVFNVPIVKIFHSTFIFDYNYNRATPAEQGLAKPGGLLGYIKNLKIEGLKGGFRYDRERAFDPGSLAPPTGQDSQKQDSQKYKISFDFIPLHQSLLDRQNENFRKSFPYPAPGSYDTATDVSTDTAVVRLKNAKLNEFFEFQSSTLTSAQPAAAGAGTPAAGSAAPETGGGEAPGAPEAASDAAKAASDLPAKKKADPNSTG